MLNPEFPPGATYLQTSVLNMFEVGLSFASLMTFLASPETMPDSAYHAYSNGCDLGESHIAAMNTDFMRGGNGHEILAASVQIGYSQIINSLVAVTETQTNVFIGMILTVGFVAFAIFAPIIIRLDMVADRIMRQFVAIPAPVRKVLFETTSRRMQMLRRDYADSDDDSDDNLDDEEEDPTAGGGGGGATAANKVGGHDDDDDDTGRLSMALHEVTKNGSGGDSDSVDSRGSAFQRNNTIDDAIGAAFRVTRLARKTRLHTKDSSTLIILLLKFISPLLILVILFSSVFATFSQEALKTKTLSAILVSAGVRASCARQAIVDLRKMTSMTVNEGYKDRSFFYTMSSLDCVRTQVRLLGSGNIDPIIADLPFTLFTEMPENGLPSFLSAEATALVHKAMYGNACEFLATNGGIASFNIPRCELFGGGVLKLGIASLIEMWWKRGYVYADHQTRIIFKSSPKDLYQGNGWMIFPTNMNYSRVVCDDSKHCAPNAVTKPMRTGILEASYVSDHSYSGDVTVGGRPGDGVSLLLADLPADTKEFHISEELNSVELEWLERCDARFMTPALLALTKIYLHEARSSTEEFLGFISFFVPLFVSLFAISIIFFFLPLTTFENKALQSKRTMLLYLPLDVVRKIKSIKRLVEEIISGDHVESSEVGAKRKSAHH